MSRKTHQNSCQKNCQNIVYAHARQSLSWLSIHCPALGFFMVGVYIHNINIVFFYIGLTVDSIDVTFFFLTLFSSFLRMWNEVLRLISWLSHCTIWTLKGTTIQPFSTPWRERCVWPPVISIKALQLTKSASRTSITVKLQTFWINWINCLSLSVLCSFT